MQDAHFKSLNALVQTIVDEILTTSLALCNQVDLCCLLDFHNVSELMLTGNFNKISIWCCQFKAVELLSTSSFTRHTNCHPWRAAHPWQL
jgi:hypothetical protein